MIDDRTPHLAIPMPHAGNTLAEDVGRLRQAFLSIDTAIAAIDALLGSDDQDLDTLQDLVNTLKTDGARLAAMLDTLAAQDGQLAAHDGRLAAAEGAISAHDARLTAQEAQPTRRPAVALALTHALSA